ncbi:fungal specific transcription factor domain-containing protein [Colletotrichum graminicola M1.001]|uniref:Fungal specific transcription factor domain-containing protein n=1 Tax=Colletotrichum graminicola (strain M1.001 / M2 / FGSC 10212) TaxID=645133 RepID=E3QZ92_COLGM|nr:fungal specific transcription factor domain-containing protein [Colletotrichum graminicola M1.001]EFQ36180.1 fungal specific transcription factor domain-containing protein [Colletotrichum graminicola M1.001]
MSATFAADQACKECRRRKAKCDRALPTCNLCVKYRRHCLYEKHARTPLTRKHLTEVEERLERAEALITHMRALMPTHSRPISSMTRQRTSDASAPKDDYSFDFSRLDRPALIDSPFRPDPVSPEPGIVPHIEDGGERQPQLPETSLRVPPVHMPSSTSYSDSNLEHTRAYRTARHHRQPVNDATHRDINLLEAHPTDDFEWDEQDTLTNYSASPEATLEVDRNGDAGTDPIADGMASLAVSEKESGYLGVASGAALLRLLEPSTPKRRAHSSSSRTGHINLTQSPLTTQLDLNRHITDAMIDAYFRLYHVSYPIIHEATFRAQYAGVIPRPCGDCWLVLAYTVAAIGVYTTATNLDNMDMHLFAQARSILSFNFLEVGNLTLVQALTLISNHQQKRDKPNSGYNYLGMAVRMAMGLGLHKEFQGWNISPLNMEIRRRVWWSLCVFDVGATITFSRPSVWPCEGVEVSLPLNVDDKSLTAISKSYPAETRDITPYTAVRTQASFHIATTPIYTRVISKPLPTANEMPKLDQELLEPWRTGVPSYFSETATVSPKYVLAHAVMNWRCRNLRVIMYRPFVIRRALQARDRRLDDSPDNVQAFEKCLADAKATITSISEFWERSEKNRLSAWYALYFLFQAALIPCICLRNDPNSNNAADWREQVTTTIRCIVALAPVNSSSPRCYQVIMDLCGRFLNDDAAAARVLAAHPRVQTAAMSGYEPNTVPIGTPDPIDESPQTQINSVLSMMWPNVPPMEAADVVMGDDAWMEFLKSGTSGDGDGVWFGS